MLVEIDSAKDFNNKEVKKGDPIRVINPPIIYGTIQKIMQDPLHPDHAVIYVQINPKLQVMTLYGDNITKTDYYSVNQIGTTFR